MKFLIFIQCLSFALLGIVAMSVNAKEVVLPHDGLKLNADLEIASGRKLEDGVILITHGALAHRDMEMLVYLRKLLKEKGYSTLAINLSLGLNNRHGMYDCKVTHRHHNNDAVNEIDAWVNWLRKQGVTRVTLLGHSRGGAQTALYAVERDNKLVNAIVLMAPAMRENTDANAYQHRYGKPLAPVLEQAQKLVREGHGDTVLKPVSLMTCRDTSATASSFLSYYGPDARVDSPSLIAKIREPVLVVVAGNDEVVVGLDRKMAPIADGKRVQMKIIDGSDHTFRDLNTDDAADAIVEFLQANPQEKSLQVSGDQPCMF